MDRRYDILMFEFLYREVLGVLLESGENLRFYKSTSDKRISVLCVGSC